MVEHEARAISLEEYRQLALNPVHEDWPSIFRLEVVEVDDLPWRHRQHYPKYSVRTWSIAYTDTLAEAEMLMRKEVEKRKEGEWLDIYCFFIHEVPKGKVHSDGQYLMKHVYDADGKLTEQTYCTSLFSFDDDSDDRHRVQTIFRGRTEEHIRFHEGHIVEVLAGEEVSLAIVVGSPLTVEWSYSRGHDFMDESDDSYVIVDGPGYEWHEHVPSYCIFAPHYKIPPYIERRFKEYYEKTVLVNRVHEAATNNREQIAQSKTCGCYSCCATFPAAEVTDYVPGEDTALCPRCGTDSVLPDTAGFPLTPNFLRRMRRKWFGN